jgi:hypothetical protein
METKSLLENWNIVEKNGQTMLWKEIDSIHEIDINNTKALLGSEPQYCSKTNSVVFLTDSNIDFRKGTNYGELELISRYIEPTQQFILG